MAITGVNTYSNNYSQYSNQVKSDNVKAENTDKLIQKDVEKIFKIRMCQIITVIYKRTMMQ